MGEHSGARLVARGALLGVLAAAAALLGDNLRAPGPRDPLPAAAARAPTTAHLQRPPPTPEPPSSDAAAWGAAGADCERLLGETGGVLGLPPPVFYSEVQRLMRVGEVLRAGPCNWTLELRHVPVPGSEVDVLAGPLAGQRAVVWTFADLDDPPRPERPSQLLRVHVGDTSALTEVAYQHVRPVPDSLSSVYPGPECPFEFRRPAVGGSVVLDLAAPPHTLAAAARGLRSNAERRKWLAVRWRWCAHQGWWADFCRACGFSCNAFPLWQPEGLQLKGHRYPLREGPVAVRLEQLSSRLAKAKRASGLRHDLAAVIHAPAPTPADERQAVLAERAGWRGKLQRAALPSGGACRETSELPTVFCPQAQWRKVLRINVGHWFHDVLFPLFTVLLGLGFIAPGGAALRKYAVAVPPGQWELAWNPLPAAADFRALEALAPVRARVLPGECFRAAFFDCPAANSMEPMPPLHSWLAARFGLSFAPLPPAPRPGLLLVVRRPRGDRHLANWREMVSAAEAAGFDAGLPWEPQELGGLSKFGTGKDYGELAAAKLLGLVPRLQRTRVLAGCHGAEIAVMVFMPRGGVVVEILPVALRLTDQWYIHQARAAELHLIRFGVPHASVEWATQRPRKGYPCPYGKVFGRKSLCWAVPPDRGRYLNRSGIPEHCRIQPVCTRTTPSRITLPIPQWRETLQLAAALLPAPA